MTMHVMTIYKMDFSLISNSRIVSWNTSVSEGKGQATTINLSLLIICHSGFQFALSSDLGGGGLLHGLHQKQSRKRKGREVRVFDFLVFLSVGWSWAGWVPPLSVSHCFSQGRHLYRTVSFQIWICFLPSPL